MTAAAADKTAGTLFEALARFQAELPAIRKGQTADTGTYKYDYADLADVSSAVLPRLGAVGLAFFARPTVRDDGRFGLAYSLVHGPSGEREDGWYNLPTDLSPQKIGGLITYARRYCLCAVTGVAPAGDDDDAAGAEHDVSRSAGDAFEQASTNRPQPQPQSRPQQRAAAARPAESVPPSDSRPWLDRAIEQAAALRSEHAADKLWKEALAKVNAGEVSRDDYDSLKGLIGAGVEDLRKKAMDRELNLLSENDEWRAKVEELDGDEAGQAALEELGRMVAGRKMPETRAGRIRRAIVARWPHATDTDSEAIA
jgi:hypothetical protein